MEGNAACHPTLRSRGALWRRRLGGPWRICSCRLSRARWPPAASPRWACLGGVSWARAACRTLANCRPFAACWWSSTKSSHGGLHPRTPAPFLPGAPRRHAGGRPASGGGCQGQAPGSHAAHLAGRFGCVWRGRGLYGRPAGMQDGTALTLLQAACIYLSVWLSVTLPLPRPSLPDSRRTSSCCARWLR